MIIDQLTITLIAAVLNGVSLAIGMVIGTRLTGSVLSKTIKKVMKESPSLKKLEDILTKIDDEKVVEQVTGFFKEARDLVTSPEARQFFKNAAELMKEFSGEKKVKLKLPPKKKD